MGADRRPALPGIFLRVPAPDRSRSALILLQARSQIAPKCLRPEGHSSCHSRLMMPGFFITCALGVLAGGRSLWLPPKQGLVPARGSAGWGRTGQIAPAVLRVLRAPRRGRDVPLRGAPGFFTTKDTKRTKHDGEGRAATMECGAPAPLWIYGCVAGRCRHAGKLMPLLVGRRGWGRSNPKRRTSAALHRSKAACAAFARQPSAFVLRPSSFIPHPSAFVLGHSRSVWFFVFFVVSKVATRGH